MFPEVLELAGEERDGPTPGEVEVFRVLRDAVKPDSEYHAFYEPAMGRGARRKWPDFVLFGRHIGIFVIEVKDWRARQIVKGPPGSGKTLVLTYRCKFLSQFDPDAKNILFVCYNIALASYIKRLVQEHGIRLGPGAVRVYHFFELCSAVLGEDVAYDGENAEYYEMVVNMCRERIVTHCAQIGPFDAVLVDEGQDFDANMFRVLRGLLRSDGALVIAVDSEQNLYHKKTKLAQTWKSLGIDIQGHVVNLPPGLPRGAGARAVG